MYVSEKFHFDQLSDVIKTGCDVMMINSYQQLQLLHEAVEVEERNQQAVELKEYKLFKCVI